MDARDGWQHDPAADAVVQPMCGGATAGCPVRSFYFRADEDFRRQYARVRSS
jgi:hypothetical protein